MVTVHGNYVQFRFYRPQAARVSQAGDFNAWRTDELAMVRSDGGYWVAVMRLPGGSHRFRYWADGQWFCDFAAFGIDVGPLGTVAVVRVPFQAGCSPAA